VYKYNNNNEKVATSFFYYSYCRFIITYNDYSKKKSVYDLKKIVKLSIYDSNKKIF
jgi:hypothetical protein